MLVFLLTKAVPARTTRVVTVGGVLRREEMDLVINPLDFKALQAADYAKRYNGGKLVAVSMGPDFKVKPLLSELYSHPIEGVDEAFVLSDRRMAGADTWATAYTLSLGLKKVLDANKAAVDEVLELVESGAPPERVLERARELYHSNLLPNLIYTEKPGLPQGVVQSYAREKAGAEEVREALEKVRAELDRFLIVAGLKTSDGETGSTGPQTAEALSDVLGKRIPDITHVTDFEVDAESGTLIAVRKLGSYVQKLRSPLPCVITIMPEYRAGVTPVVRRKRAALFSYKGKVREVRVWNADQIGADPSKIGLPGSPTIVGPGIDIGGPPVQKFVGRTKVFAQRVEAFEFNGQKYGPFERFAKADELPEGLVRELEVKGIVKTFDLRDLLEEVLGGVVVTAKH
jgi:electron transfer flavoprotein beta subunit